MAALHDADRLSRSTSHVLLSDPLTSAPSPAGVTPVGYSALPSSSMGLLVSI